MTDLTNAVAEAMTAEIKRRPVAVPSGSIFDGQIGVYGGATMQDLSSVAVAALYAEVAKLHPDDGTGFCRECDHRMPCNTRRLFPPSLWGGE